MPEPLATPLVIAWFMCEYAQKKDPPPSLLRYSAMNDYTQQIQADGGTWTESEVLGNYALVKVKAQSATMNVIKRDKRIYLLPHVQFTEQCIDGAGLQAVLLKQGYGQVEIDLGLPGGITAHTFGDWTHFSATRRRDPRYDAANDVIVCDGAVQACTSPDLVDAEVQ